MLDQQFYKCYKCNNTLLLSNKMLHDLRCTEENPATYENILSQNLMSETYSENQTYNPSTSPSSFSSNRMSIKNEDGTMTDIRKEKSMLGKEELVEIKYDPEGNIISRKKADKFIFNDNNNDFQEDFYDNDGNNNYYNEQIDTMNEHNEQIYINNNIQENVIYHEPIEQIVYEAPPQYDPNVTINKPIEQTIINTNVNMSNDLLNDIIRKTMTRNSNNNNSNILPNFFNNQINDNSNQTFFYQNDSNQNFLEPNLQNYNNIGTDDVLRRTAGIPNLNPENDDFQY